MDTSQLVDRMVGDLATAIAETEASVTRDSLPTVMRDATQLRQVFQNLIANGIKFRLTLPTTIFDEKEDV